MAMLEGKAVVVTGAGRGIGRELALACAKSGAAVVVNDLGVSADGQGAELGPAEEVVAEIRKDGGKAITNGASVADAAGAQSIIADCVKAFGKIDGVINNAGFLRDKIFHKMTEAEWRPVLDVHLNGSFNVSNAAASYFKDQGHGAFVHFTSTSGLIGNFGQANYAAAKMGIIGLSTSIALDMQRFNVRSNCIAPFAWSRMIATVPPKNEEELQRIERLKSMSADKIPPMAVYLLSDAAKDVTGQIFSVRKNEILLFSLPRPIRSMSRTDGWTPETIASELVPAFRPSFQALQRSAEVFPYDPI